MKSIKPGRGPSMMGAVGSGAAAIFGVIWTISAISMGAPGFFPLFGIVFVVIGIVQMSYNFKNATGKNRFSTFDITDNNEESDPLNKYFGEQDNSQKIIKDDNNQVENTFCPYCGIKVEEGFLFCRKCGKKLP